MVRKWATQKCCPFFAHFLQKPTKKGVKSQKIEKKVPIFKKWAKKGALKKKKVNTIFFVFFFSCPSSSLAYSLENSLFFSPFQVKKRPLSQKKIALISFSFIFSLKPLLSCPYLVNIVKFVKTTLYHRPKVNRIPFFPKFQAKITALMPVFCQINVHSLRRCSHAHVLSTKLSFSLNFSNFS